MGCEKCGAFKGSRDADNQPYIRVRFHRGGGDCQKANCLTMASCDEHLHRFCDRCGYDWIEPCEDANAAAVEDLRRSVEAMRRK